MCPITSSLEAAIPEITVEAVEAVEAVEEAPAIEVVEAVEASMEAVEAAEAAVPKIPTPIVGRSASASASAHLAMDSLYTVRRGYPCGSEQG